MNYNPPYDISDKIVSLVASITEKLTRITITNNLVSNPKLRRNNRVKTIHASLAIENNTLSFCQVTDIINGKRVLGPAKDICEVKNAFEAYNKLLTLNPYAIDDLLLAHKILMKELTYEAGKYRSKGVGIFAGEKLVHMAPPAKNVSTLVSNLIEWVKCENNVHPLIKSSVFHYEFEFIHPFSDGNGRMGRMWQTLILYQWNTIFGWLPIESVIKERQAEYYAVLGECDKVGNSSKFIEYILSAINDSLKEVATDQVSVQVPDQVQRLVRVLGNEELSTKELMNRMGLNHRANFRENYLIPAIKLGFIEMTIPDKPNSSKQRYKKVIT